MTTAGCNGFPADDTPPTYDAPRVNCQLKSCNGPPKPSHAHSPQLLEDGTLPFQQICALEQSLPLFLSLAAPPSRWAAAATATTPLPCRALSIPVSISITTTIPGPISLAAAFSISICISAISGARATTLVAMQAASSLFGPPLVLVHHFSRSLFCTGMSL